MAGLAHDRHATSLLHLLDGVPGQARVMDDLAARLAREQRGGQQADQVVALDEVAIGVEEEAAVEVAIPGDAEVGTVFAYRVAGGRAVFRQQRGGNAVGEAAVGLMLDADEFEGQVRGQCVDHQAGTTVASVGDDLQRLQAGDIDVAEQVLDVGRFVGILADRAVTVAQRRVGGREVADVEQAGIAADRLGLFAHQLHAVVIHRIVAGSNHDAAGSLAVERLEVHFLGAAQADVDDIAATCGEPFDRGLQQLRAAQADVMADDDRSRPQQCRRACADALGQVGVEFIRNPTTDVIGLETRERHQCGPNWGDRRL
ncbi:hypothetical protein G6F31_015220 [Rhizopus arrhizus]|nr:hypothetical protein G6F31_015220 [Rhizopus arrhizus]